MTEFEREILHSADVSPFNEYTFGGFSSTEWRRIEGLIAWSESIRINDTNELWTTVIAETLDTLNKGV